MAQRSLYSDLDLVPRGYKINPDWNRNFREDRDKKTKLFDEILDMTIREHTKYQRTMLEDVYFTKYWGWDNYCLVFKMKEDYDNLEVLFGDVLECTDDALRWYDITEFINFNVYIITPYRTFRLTYLDLLYEYVTMSHSRGSVGTINNHPRLRKMKEWVTRYSEYERYTRKSTLSRDPYSYMDRGREQREFLGLRNDNRPLPSEHIGMLPGYSDYSRGGEQFYQQALLNQQRELMRGQMSLRWSDYETNNPCAEIELPNVTVKQRVSKLNKLLNKLKLK